MTAIYAVTTTDYDGSETYGVFSTRERAQAFIDLRAGSLDSPEIDERELDKVEYGEGYAHHFRVPIADSGEVGDVSPVWVESTPPDAWYYFSSDATLITYVQTYDKSVAKRTARRRAQAYLKRGAWGKRSETKERVRSRPITIEITERRRGKFETAFGRGEDEMSDEARVKLTTQAAILAGAHEEFELRGGVGFWHTLILGPGLELNFEKTQTLAGLRDLIDDYLEDR